MVKGSGQSDWHATTKSVSEQAVVTCCGHLLEDFSFGWVLLRRAHIHKWAREMIGAIVPIDGRVIVQLVVVIENVCTRKSASEYVGVGG